MPLEMNKTMEILTFVLAEIQTSQVQLRFIIARMGLLSQGSEENI
jgi:hypothetical protein